LKVYDIRNYGVVSGSESLQTEAIQKAIDDCFLNGGGEVQIPEGVYRTGDIRIRSNVTLHLLEKACLLGSRNPEDYFHYLDDSVEPLSAEDITDAPYVHLSTIKGETAYEENKSEYRFKRIPGSHWNNGLIRAIHAKNIAVIGEKDSVIDGSNCYDEEGEELYRGPHGMTFFDCENIALKGYTIQNTGNWAHNFLFCDNIDVKDITALAGHDGFDAAVCNNITIRDSAFYTGDDCVAGFGNANVLVQNCVLNSSCSAMRFGGTNVLVEKCHIYGPGRYSFRGGLTKAEKAAGVMAQNGNARNNMLSAFTYYADYSLPIPDLPGHIIISDCVIESADRFLHYNYSGNETWQKHRPLSDITYKNIKATGVSMPITAYGDETWRITLKMENVDLSLREGHEEIDLLHVCNYDEISLKNVTVKNASGGSLIKKWSEGRILLENVVAEGCKEKVKTAEEPFFAMTI